MQIAKSQTVQIQYFFKAAFLISSHGGWIILLLWAILDL